MSLFRQLAQTNASGSGSKLSAVLRGLRLGVRLPLGAASSAAVRTFVSLSSQVRPSAGPH
eukprot:2993623-Pyramimonas_sp.AAC.1